MTISWERNGRAIMAASVFVAICALSSIGELTVRAGGLEMSMGRAAEGYALKVAAATCDACFPIGFEVRN